MPFFSCGRESASMTLPRLHSSMNAASRGIAARRRRASGCSAAMAMKVTPNSVSARVVNTFSAAVAAAISARVSAS